MDKKNYLKNFKKSIKEVNSFLCNLNSLLFVKKIVKKLK